MRLTIITLLCCLSISCSNKYKEAANSDQDYAIIPKPLSMEMATGKFLIDSNTKVAGDASLEKEGQLLADMLGAASNENIEFSTEGKKR